MPIIQIDYYLQSILQDSDVCKDVQHIDKDNEDDEDDEDDEEYDADVLQHRDSVATRTDGFLPLPSGFRSLTKETQDVSYAASI